jgi:uncharacterized protein (TIGR03083 family)
MSSDDVVRMIGAERREMAQVLQALTEPQWDTPSLCAGWRVREVVAHMTMPFRHSAPRVVLGILAAGGNFNRAADRFARRDARLESSRQLAECLRRNADSRWKPPGGGFEGALTHEVVHGLDVTVALGIDRRLPPDRLEAVLAQVGAPRSLKHFGNPTEGCELRATDLDWSFGAGAPVVGTAADLLLVMCGRRLPTGRLSGEASHKFLAPHVFST